MSKAIYALAVIDVFLDPKAKVHSDHPSKSQDLAEAREGIAEMCRLILQLDELYASGCDVDQAIQDLAVMAHEFRAGALAKV
jgi:hypothetical protein